MAISYAKSLAIIDEKNCIGCTLCIKACPFDAIIGASQQLHSVVKQLCTGCKLCIEPCPVDCISMVDNHELDNILPDATNFSQHKACIDCDKCAPVCPSNLSPDVLYKELKTNKYHRLTELMIDKCTACGECNKVCPSHIPLSQSFTYGNAMLAIKNQQKEFSLESKKRLKQRELRLANKASSKDSMLANNKLNIADKLQALKNSQLNS